MPLLPPQGCVANYYKYVVMLPEDATGRTQDLAARHPQRAMLRRGLMNSRCIAIRSLPISIRVI